MFMMGVSGNERSQERVVKMGTKFASIQVRTEDIDAVRAAIEAYAPTIKEQREARKHRAAKVMGLPETFIGSSDEIYYVGQVTAGWVIVLNVEFSWGSVAEPAAELSGHIAAPVVAVGYFDDDVLELEVFHQGQQVTKILACSEGSAEAYGLEATVGDLEALVRILELPSDATALGEIFEREVMEMTDALEQEFCTALEIKADWLDSYEAEMKSKFIKLTF